jgi:branched-chain amino acid transport system substrate-binding protein
LFDLEMDQPVLGVDPPQNVMISALGANVSNDVITRHLAVPGTDQFNTLGEKVSERYDQPMYAYPPIGYMNVMMLAEAIAEAGADPSGIADYIRTGSFDMLYANPLSYTEWGEFEDPILQYSELVEGAPSYYPNGEYHLEVVSESEPLPAPEPGA